MDERVVKRLVSTIKCESCGQRYKTYNIDILGHNDDTWFLKLLCSSCYTQSMVAAIIKEVKRTESVTDITEAEQRKFAGAALVGVDDVLDMHHFLKTFDGDFANLFG